ncbi:glycosyl transferase family 2 [Desulfovibrio sp. DV]|uniref:glycosyltransferase family 2 protein n=1 Tax=Desulfovibrio sp. DV TaxID=1844708 RepID=UPI00094BB504|nr:glycosyltransferase [Desulfovibrio sp. DV]OLN24526.1 glycosyl transferase family 2 [Desulfovibrio sp. DV]
MFCNPDAVMHPEALAAFAADADKRPDVGLFGATVVEAARPDRLQAAGGSRYYPALTVHRPAHAGRRLAAVSDLPEPQLDYISGACLFVRREVFDRVGLFDPGYFLFCEELDLCRRAGRAGFGLGWTRQAVCVHVGGSSLARVAGPARERAAFAQYHETASALRFVWRHHRAVFAVAAAFRLCGKLAVLARRRELHLAGALAAAYRDFVTGQGPVPGGSRPPGRFWGR